MTCPRCGTEMNHHADKIDYLAVISGDELADADLGGSLKEIHTCPKCGNVENRLAEMNGAFRGIF